MASAPATALPRQGLPGIALPVAAGQQLLDLPIRTVKAGRAVPRRTFRVAAVAVLSWGLAVPALTLHGLREVAGAGAVSFLVLSTAAPYLYAALVPVLLLALSMRRWWRAALVAALLVVHPGWVLAGLPVAAPVFGGSAAAASPTGAQVRVFSANLNMYNGGTGGIAAQIAREDPDVVLLLEWSPTSSAPLIASGVLLRYPNRLERQEASRSDGIALFTRLELDARLEVLGERHVVSAVLGDSDSSFRFVGVHPHSPVNERKAALWHAQLRALPELLDGEQLPLVVAGDFNATKAHEPFARLLSSAGLTDAHEVAGSGWTATWPADRGILPPVVRPDRVLTGAGVQVVDARVGDSSGSDHRPVVVDLVVTHP